MTENAIEINHITKKYKLYASEKDRLKEAFHPFKKSYHRPFYALKDVNFNIKKGEKVGIIGANGAGKSTLLKVITEVIKPTEGSFVINGRVAALLELGVGFNMDYSGIENIKLNGTLMGYTAEEMEEKTQQIIEFADIGEFIDQPVKNYSSGMFVRLAFATQIFSDPDILIVDEALSVGDIRFQQKCYRAMDSLMKDKTVVLVTHDTAAVTRFCRRVVWINHGEVAFDGDSVEGLKRYQEYLINSMNESNAESETEIQKGDVIEAKEAAEATQIPTVCNNVKCMGNGNALITHCAIMDTEGRLVDLVEPGSQIDVVVRVDFKKHVQRPLYGFVLHDRLGNDILEINSETLEVQLPPAEGTIEYHMMINVPPLNRGEYVCSVAVASGTQMEHVQLCWIDDALVFRIPERNNDLGSFLYMDEGIIEVRKI